MLMPVVTLNKMAMNESVATSCCFREVATPTAVYWEVLNGGWIGDGYTGGKVTNSFYEDMDSSWYDYKYDINFEDAPAGEDAMRMFLKYGEYTDASAAPGTPATKDWYVFDSGAMGPGFATITPMALAGFLRGGAINIRPGETCDHTTNPDCLYRKSTTAFVTDYHFEATKKHSSIKSGFTWDAPHPAQKFSS